MLPGIVDVTRITGAKAVGSPTSWQTPNGPFNVEHVGVTSAANELLAFWWSPQHDWQVVNVTAKTGQHVIGGIAALADPQRPLPRRAPRRATPPRATSSCSGWSPQHDWQAVNVSAKTGKAHRRCARELAHPGRCRRNCRASRRAWRPQRAAGVLLDTRARLAGRGRDGEDRSRRSGRPDGVAVHQRSDDRRAPRGRLAGRHPLGVLVVAGARLAGAQRLGDRGRRRHGPDRQLARRRRRTRRRARQQQRTVRLLVDACDELAQG